MKYRIIQSMIAGSLLTLISPSHAAPADQDNKPASSTDMKEVESIIADWPSMSQLGVRMTVAKHGAPHGVTPEAMTWTDVGPYKSITVTKHEDHHDFPMPHMDFMEHTISYLVPVEKAAELAAFDGSLTYDRTRGLMSARCDLEAHNLLTLNLAHDIIEGKKTAAEARMEFGKIVGEDNAGMNPAYTTKLQFEPNALVGYTDLATMPGAPARATELKDAKTGGDAEVLAHIIAADINEVVAAKAAAVMDVKPPVKEYAEMLQKHHAMNAAATMGLAGEIDILPVMTKEVGAMRMKAAGNLADLMAKADGDFGQLYINAKVEGHQNDLEMIDNKLMKNAGNDKVKSHLSETRAVIAGHLERAREIQSEMDGKKSPADE